MIMKKPVIISDDDCGDDDDGCGDNDEDDDTICNVINVVFGHQSL